MINVRVIGFHAGLFAACFSLPLCLPAPALAQSEITVYAPFRGIATPIARAGSSVSVITREEIEQAGQISVAELLRTVPGVNIVGAGGFGSNSDVFIRGGESHHTMVLIDGVPVSNTTSPRNTFDFSSIAPDMIEQIEVLRGPQSALYGSDAIGGVINIITRQASSGVSASASVEGGSYGTHREVLQASYGSPTVGIIGSVSHAYTDGPSRRSDDNEDDATRQWSGFLRGTVHLSETLSVDAQFQANETEADYDSDSSADDDRHRSLNTANGSLRVRHESFDARWINSLTLYGGVTDTLDDFGASDDRTYDGERLGLEATSSFDFEGYGTLLAGISVEEQSARQAVVQTSTVQYSGSELYLAAFLMHQFSIGQNLHLSAALRVDDFDAAGVFVTGRGTAVYEIYETETRLHASAGTGANAPTLYQRFGPFGANPDLLPEESIGFDAGITQVLFDGRATVDVTGFYNLIENQIDYVGGYINRSEAETYGIEVTADTRLIPGQLDATAHYTYLVANDVSTGLRLARRPEHEGQLTLTYTGIDRLRLSGTVSGVGGDWFNDDANTTRLDPYVRVDVNASYQVHEHLELFGRVENLFDTDYQERDGYNTPGLSAYAGIRATF